MEREGRGNGEVKYEARGCASGVEWALEMAIKACREWRTCAPRVLLEPRRDSTRFEGPSINARRRSRRRAARRQMTREALLLERRGGEPLASNSQSLLYSIVQCLRVRIRILSSRAHTIRRFQWKRSDSRELQGTRHRGAHCPHAREAKYSALKSELILEKIQ